MKKLLLFCAIVFGICSMAGCAEKSIGGVRITDVETGEHESSYRIEAELDALDQSVISQQIWDALAEDWLENSELTEHERMYSSHAWGSCSAEFDSWSDCERFTGVSVSDPLDGDDGFELSLVRADWYGTQNGRLNALSMKAEYLYGEVRVTLGIDFNCTDEPVLTTGCAWASAVSFKTETRSLDNGTKALVVMPQDAGNYSCATAYFIKENVLYSLDATGASGEENEINDVLNKALSAF